HTLYSGETTLLLWTPIEPLSYKAVLHPARLFVGGGLLGCIVIAFTSCRPQQRMAIGVLICEAILLVVGFSNYLLQYWVGPAIWYFEVMLFPYFALGCCYLVVTCLIVAHRAVNHVSFLPRTSIRRLPTRIADAAFVLVLAGSMPI